MNAVCHRDYESNGPIQFYQYDDRIEILNPGGLYGKANPRNFPWINDYRNGVIAEAMKVIGFVNRFSRGVQRVQEELKVNGNEDADFNLELETAFLVRVKISKKSFASSGEAKGEAKDCEISLSKSALLVYREIISDPHVTRSALASTLQISETKAYRATIELKNNNIIRRIGGRKLGYWEILKILGTD